MLFRIYVVASYVVMLMVYWITVTCNNNIISTRGTGQHIISVHYCCSPNVNYVQEGWGWKPIPVWDPLKGGHCDFIHICKHFLEDSSLCGKGQRCWEQSDKWTCEPPLSDCEATMTVRLSPITAKGNLSQQSITKGLCLDSLGRFTHNTQKGLLSGHWN